MTSMLVILESKYASSFREPYFKNEKNLCPIQRYKNIDNLDDELANRSTLQIKDSVRAKKIDNQIFVW